jgi:glycerol 2-dehydrogenase (NADP+)
MHFPQSVIPAEGEPLLTVNGKVLPPDASPTFAETWVEMEKLLDTGSFAIVWGDPDAEVVNPCAGKVKAIGISNCGLPLVRELLKTAKVVPAVNQIESHPSLPYNELKSFCEEHGILFSAHSPLGRVFRCPR